MTNIAPVIAALTCVLCDLVQQWRRRSFNGHFPGQCGKAGTRMFPFLTLLEPSMIWYHLVQQCQTILGFTAARDDVVGGGDIRYSEHVQITCT